jgi:hypothetical protein
MEGEYEKEISWKDIYNRTFYFDFHVAYTCSTMRMCRKDDDLYKAVFKHISFCSAFLVFGT